MLSSQRTSRSEFRQLAWLLCAVLIIRAGAGLAGWQSLHEDPDSYARLAVGLADVGVFGFASAPLHQISPTAYRPPLYPWLLSWFISDSELLPAGVFCLHLGLSLAVAALAFRVACKLKLRWSVLAGLLVSIDPILIRAGQQVMTELLATFLVLVAWWLWLTIWPKSSINADFCLTTKRSIKQWTALYGLGIAFGLSMLARPTAAPWVATCIVLMLWFGCWCWKRRLVDMVVVATGVLLCVLPWTLRNMAEMGQPIWATTHGGYTLLLANNPSLFQHFQQLGPSRQWNADTFHQAWASRGKFDQEVLMDSPYWLGATIDDSANRKSELQEPVENGLAVHSLGELADDRLAYQIAWHTIGKNPRVFALSCLYRIGWLWAWWPSGVSPIATLAIGSWYGTVFVLAVLGLIEILCGARASFGLRATGDSGDAPGGIRRRIGELGHWLPGLTLILVLSAIHCIYWSNMRMRAPAMPCIYLLALVAMAKRRPQ